MHLFVSMNMIHTCWSTCALKGLKIIQPAKQAGVTHTCWCNCIETALNAPSDSQTLNVYSHAFVHFYEQDPHRLVHVCSQRTYASQGVKQAGIVHTLVDRMHHWICIKCAMWLTNIGCIFTCICWILWSWSTPAGPHVFWKDSKLYKQRSKQESHTNVDAFALKLH